MFDSVVFSLTLYKAFTVEERVNLLYVIVRDGALCLVIHYAKSFIISVRHDVLLVRAILFFSPLKRISTILNRALSLMNLGNIMTLLVRLDLSLQLFKLLTIKLS